MLKPAESVKQAERDLVETLLQRLEGIPFASVGEVRLSVDLGGVEADGLVDIEFNNGGATLVLEVKSSGQPRMIRSAIENVRRAIARLRPRHSIGLVGAPFMSEQAKRLCVDANVGYIDLVGNCRLVGPNVYIDYTTTETPKSAQRELKSVFAPKSARILRTMLRQPDTAWKVADLAEAAGVSLGQVSNVRKALIDREWAEVADDGLKLTDRAALIRAWREAYTPTVGERRSYYTTLHGKALEAALASALAKANADGKAAAMSFTAADAIAPYGRPSSTYLAAEPAALPALVEGLRLKPVSSGANVEVLIPDDPDFFADLRTASRGLITTSGVQTYLDLSMAGERGVEAADVLLEKLDRW